MDEFVPSSEDTPADTPAPRVWREGDRIPADVNKVLGGRSKHVWSRHESDPARPLVARWCTASRAVAAEGDLLQLELRVSEVPAGGKA
jgi:hypothetical protein